MIQIDTKKQKKAPETAASTYVEQSALDRLINIQNAIKKTWQGVNTLHSGRPGNDLKINDKLFRHSKYREQKASKLLNSLGSA